MGSVSRGQVFMGMNLTMTVITILYAEDYIIPQTGK